MKNVFDQEVTSGLIGRINSLTPLTQPLWGKMNVGQMLAHCNVSYEMAEGDKHPKPKGIIKLILRYFVKNFVVNEKPFKKNSGTAPQFLMTGEKDFEAEKGRLIDYIQKTQALGENYFDNRESHSFGVLTKKQWSNMFYKHLDHHLQQFGV